MILELTIAIVVLFTGIGIIVFSRQIGTFVFDFNMELRRGLTGTREEKRPRRPWWLTSWYTIGLRYGPSFDIWLARIIGIGIIVGAIILLGIFTEMIV